MQIGSREDGNDLNYDYDNERWVAHDEFDGWVVDSGRDNDAATVWLLWTKLKTLNELDTKTSKLDTTMQSLIQ